MDVPQFIAGRFRIEREIGTGGMGTVYLATHLDLERPVAVKIIRREFAGDADVTDRFLREARTMAKLRHPNAAMIFDNVYCVVETGRLSRNRFTFSFRSFVTVNITVSTLRRTSTTMNDTLAT